MTARVNTTLQSSTGAERAPDPGVAEPPGRKEDVMLKLLRPTASLSSERGSRTLVLASGLAVLVGAARLSLHPVFCDVGVYTVFYPVILATALLLGPRPAALATTVSAAIGYIAVAHPAWTAKFDTTSLAALGFFLVTSAVCILLLSIMTRTLRELEAARTRAETLAQGHATLFRDINERVTNHLQLVSALLQVQARDSHDGTIRRALSEAAARTMMISRLHRDLAGDTTEPLDFEVFATRLIQAVRAEPGGASLEVELGGDRLRLAPHQATSAAIVLLECLESKLATDQPVALRLTLQADEATARIEMTEADTAAFSLLTPQRLALIDAMVEQLGGAFSQRSDRRGSVMALSFPLDSAPSAGAVVTVH